MGAPPVPMFWLPPRHKLAGCRRTISIDLGCSVKTPPPLEVYEFDKIGGGDGNIDTDVDVENKLDSNR